MYSTQFRRNSTVHATPQFGEITYFHSTGMRNKAVVSMFMQDLPKQILNFYHRFSYTKHAELGRDKQAKHRRTSLWDTYTRKYSCGHINSTFF